MHWSRTLQLVDVHCEGEIGRVITSGVLNIPGETMADKLAHINSVDDTLRRALVLEPRGGPTTAVVLLTPPTRPEADAGFILFLADKAYPMSGSNMMCAATALIETGAIQMVEPETRVVFDSALGLVTVIADCAGGRIERLRIAMPPAFVDRQDAVVHSSEHGAVRYDLCFGGMYFAIIDVAEVGLEIVPENAGILARTGVALRNQIADEISVQHPEMVDFNALTHVTFISEAEDGAVLTCTTMRPGRVDRSACGTGSAALAALRVARGENRVGDVLLTRSIIGGAFRTEITSAGRVGGFDAVDTTLSGRCWIYGISQIGIDPTDPFREGFSLPDTWGGVIGGVGDVGRKARGSRLLKVPVRVRVTGT
jgi:proline racemase